MCPLFLSNCALLQACVFEVSCALRFLLADFDSLLVSCTP